MEGHGDVIIPDAQQALAAPETCDLPYLFFREVEDLLNEAGFLLLHLHDEFDTAGVQNALAVLTALQTE